MKALVTLRAGAVSGIVPWKVEESVAREEGLSAREVEGLALRAGLRPERYARNFRTIDEAGQLALHEARVVVVGCGGLGGYVIEELARLGVGTLVVVDSDRFDASNLNRQILATLASLGRPKAEVAAERIASLNPATMVEARCCRFDPSNAEDILRGAGAAADALDGISARLLLESSCAALGIPLVHGGIAGWYVQASTIRPGEGSLARLYEGATGDRGIETELGNPAFTPAVAASIEVAELVKLLVGKAPALGGQLFHLDLERMEALRLPLA
jgi:molybdopterin/thiamine biosynthesis adenylyltransferase